MPVDVLMPQLSPTMTEGRLAGWLKKEGDVVKTGDIIAEVETDKATMEVEAISDGILHKIIGKPGDDIPVGTPIAILRGEGEAVAADYQPTSQAKQSEAPAPAAPAEATVAAPAAAPKAATPAASAIPAPAFNLAGAAAPQQVKTPVDTHMAAHSNGGRVVASPLAKRLAAQMGVDLSLLAGSGPGGRIVKADILNAPATGMGTARAIVRMADTLEKNTPMRKAIAERLTASKQHVPHFYLTADVTMDAVLEVRKQLNERAEGKYKLTVNDFIIKACALALRAHPAANAAWNTDSVVRFGNVDISVAVAIDGGLITPIVFNADQKSLVQISGEVKDLAAKAKQGALKPEHYQGGSFSLSNLGMYGVKNFAAIINPPQAAILACGAAEPRVVAGNNGGGMVVATQMTLTLSVDHRVIDGALGALLLQSIKTYLEQPVTMFV